MIQIKRIGARIPFEFEANFLMGPGDFQPFLDIVPITAISRKRIVIMDERFFLGVRFFPDY